MKSDDLFNAPLDRAQDFQFDDAVASVFDDMVARSVPFYEEIQQLAVTFAASHITPGGTVYDVGCSTGTTLALLLPRVIQSNCQLVGIEPAVAMIRLATEKLGSAAAGRVSLREERIEELTELPGASVVLMLFALQFVRPIWRQRVVNMIAASLPSGGCFLLGEKILADDSILSRAYIDIYHRRKEEFGYSQGEIDRKREALENVLVPYRDAENRQLLAQAGFNSIDTVFRWCNFCLYIALKA